MALTVLAVPTMTYLGGLLGYGPFVTVTYGLPAASWRRSASALGGERDRPAATPCCPPLIVGAVCLAVLGVDIVTGGNLQLNTVFGYSPIVAGRFAGFGNQAFSLLAISALLVAYGGLGGGGATQPRRAAAPSSRRRRGAVRGRDRPRRGSPVRIRRGWRAGLRPGVRRLRGHAARAGGSGRGWSSLIAAATIAVLGLFAAIDLSRPAESRTHLGRFADKLVSGDFAIVLQRKLESNISVLTSTIWTLVIPVALAFFAYLTWRPGPGPAPDPGRLPDVPTLRGVRADPGPAGMGTERLGCVDAGDDAHDRVALHRHPRPPRRATRPSGDDGDDADDEDDGRRGDPPVTAGRGV